MLQQLIVDIVLPWLISEVSEWQRFLFNAMILPFFSHFSRNLRSCQAPAASHIDQRDISAFRRPCFTAPWFCEHRRAAISNDANQPSTRHFNNGSNCISDMKIRALCPISGSNNSRKRHEMRLISKLGTVHPLGINERFSYI